MPRRDDADDADDGDPIRLDSDDHAWWSTGEVQRPWVPPAPPDGPERDPLAEHLGETWRVDFGLDPPGASEPDDPYELLALDPQATWDEIVAAHRREARLHHPDRLVDAGQAEQDAAENRIRRINAAYRELKIRRGR